MNASSRHWLALRLSAALLFVLSFYFITQIEHIVTKSRDNFAYWAKQPLTKYALTAFILAGFYHACLGMEEIIEDYVQAKGLKAASLLVNKLSFAALGAVSLYSLWNLT